jgi:hypothetical protein
MGLFKVILKNKVWKFLRPSQRTNSLHTENPKEGKVFAIHDIKTYKGRGVQLLSLLPSAIDGGNWFMSLSGRIIQ